MMLISFCRFRFLALFATAFGGLFCGFYLTLITMAHSYLEPFYLEYELWQYGDVSSHSSYFQFGLLG